MIGWVGNDMKDLSIASHVSVCVFSDRTMANQQLEFVLQASVCVFSDRTMVYAAAAVSHCMLKHSLQASVCVFSDRMMAHEHLEFVACQRVCFF